eukprot:gene8549-5995_t
MLQPAVPVPADLLQLHNRSFTHKAWSAGLRPDQRRAEQVRTLHLELFHGVGSRRIHDESVASVPALAFRQNSTRAALRLGATHLIASIHCHLVEPLAQQPKHGFFDIQVKNVAHERSCAAGGGDANISPNTFPFTCAQLRAFLLRLFKGGVIDTEGLCVVPGRHVWSLTINVSIVHNDGNVLDAAELAVLALLLAHRRPEALILPQTKNGEGVRLLEEWERDPAPLSLLHTPLSCSFVVPRDPLEQSPPTPSVTSTEPPAAAPSIRLVADPTAEEAAAAASSLTVVVNREGQVCALEKGGGPGVAMAHVLEAVALAGGDTPLGIADYWWSVIDLAVKRLEEERRTARQAQFRWAKQREGVASAAAKRPREE